MDNKTTNFIKKIAFFAIMAILFASTIFFTSERRFDKITTDHFKAIVGLPAAFLCSLLLILLLKQKEAPIEFKGLSFEFKGISGEIILWVICFLSISHAINLLWN